MKCCVRCVEDLLCDALPVGNVRTYERKAQESFVSVIATGKVRPNDFVYVRHPSLFASTSQIFKSLAHGGRCCCRR